MRGLKIDLMDISVKDVSFFYIISKQNIHIAVYVVKQLEKKLITKSIAKDVGKLENVNYGGIVKEKAKFQVQKMPISKAIPMV